MTYVFNGPAVSSPKLSKYFSLKDLTITQLKVPNEPQGEALANLKRLAGVLDQLYDRIGPFSVISAYRSPEAQNALKSGQGGSAAASQAATHSFHTQGLAADIVPSKMSANEFFSAIAASSELRNLLGEIAIKTNGPPLAPAQTIHLSVATPSKKGVLMYVDAAGRYVRMASTELTQFLSRYRKPIAIAGGILIPFAAAIALYFYLKSRKK